MSVPYQSIQTEVENLNGVCGRLESLADNHAPIADALLKIAGTVRSTAVLLAILISSRDPKLV
jgi:hypothetical protein